MHCDGFYSIDASPFFDMLLTCFRLVYCISFPFPSYIMIGSCVSNSHFQLLICPNLVDLGIPPVGYVTLGMDNSMICKTVYHTSKLFFAVI